MSNQFHSNFNSSNEYSSELSFSQLLEVQSYKSQRRPRPINLTAQNDRAPFDLKCVIEEDETTVNPNRHDIYQELSASNSSLNEVAVEEDSKIARDVYRFVQPRRLSSWVQDDAVYACFKCHSLFSLLIRKHHCRACGRIFCASCSSQRVVIPGDYESIPVSALSRASYSSFTSNATDVIGNIGWYLLPFSQQGQDVNFKELDFMEKSLGGPAAQQQEQFLENVNRLQRENVISNFIPCSARSRSNSAGLYTRSINSYSSSHVPPGSVLQRVCDDCACALQQRHQHYHTLRVFELCEFDLKELRVLGQVCRKWHRASIMCLSIFRQIQYYLPTHRLSEKEKRLLIMNRKYLGGHTKWLLQLIKAVDFTEEDMDDRIGADKDGNNKYEFVEDVLALLEKPRDHTCMLTMCSRLCKTAIGSVDALEILSDNCARNSRLRAMCVDALTQSANDEEWLSYLPVLLHTLSEEHNAAESKLGLAMIRQARCDLRFCYDLYWGLTVTAEDASWRRKFDGMRQRLLLHISQPKEHCLGSNNCILDDNIADQLLRGQQFVDIMWKLPTRVETNLITDAFKINMIKSMLFDPPESPCPLRLPVDPSIHITGIDFDSIEIKRSAEAPIIITCTGAKQDNDSIHREDTASLHVNRMSPIKAKGLAAKVPTYRIMYKRDDLRKDAIVQNIIHVMYSILKRETRLNIPLVTYRVLPTSSYDGLIEIVEDAHTLYSIVRDYSNILNFLHHYNGHRTLSEISSSFRESLAAYTVITFLLGVGDRHADNVMLTKDGILFHIDYGFILGKDPKPLQPPMRLDHFMIEALGGSQTQQFEQFKQHCIVAFNCLRRHVSLFMIMLSLVVKAIPEITDFGVNYTRSDLEAFVIERFLPGQSDEEAATALMLRMEGKFNEKIGMHLSDFVHAHANEKTVSKGMLSVGSSVKLGVETVEATVSTVANSISSGASSIYKFMWGGN